MTTENKTTHSPLPWRVEKNLYGTANIIETDGRQIAACATECQSSHLDEDAAQDEANAALIVAAVNQHDKLRNALKEAIRLFADRVVLGGYPDECVWLEQARYALGD